MNSWRALLAAVLATFAFVSISQACPFCSAERGPTMVEGFAEAMAVVLVHVADGPVQDGNGVFFTEVTIDQVLKSHDFLKDKKTFKLMKSLEKGSRWLLYCDFYRGKIDAYRGVDVNPNGEMIKYLQGALASKQKAISERLRFAFDFLNSADLAVALDAYREFAKADYKDYMIMAKSLPPDKIAVWISDSKTAPYRLGLYASLLGHCGKAEHAKLLRAKIEEAIKNKNSSSLDGLLAGYIMLNPKEAWGYVQHILRDGKQDFLVSYTCVRTAAFLREQRPDLVPAKDLTSAILLVLENPDMADLGIEYLRKAKAWETTAQVLELHGKKVPGKNFDNELIKRSILRFALSSPEPAAAAFVKAMRARDPEYVGLQEELLRLEP